MLNFARFVLICAIFCQYTVQDSVDVSLYYESLCPDCIRFITNQLYSGYQKIGDNIIIDLIPYGKAQQVKIDGKWKFHCQHGPQECFGNKVQACVIKHHPDADTQMSFVECMMNSTDPASVTIGEQCAIETNLLWSTIEKCSNGCEGNELLAYYGTRTAALGRLPHVPYLLFNGVYNETLENRAFKDFVKTICDLLEVKPDICLEQ